VDGTNDRVADDDGAGACDELSRVADGSCGPGETATAELLTTTVCELVARDEVQAVLAEARNTTASRPNTERTAPTVPRPATAAAPERPAVT